MPWLPDVFPFHHDPSRGHKKMSHEKIAGFRQNCPSFQSILLACFFLFPCTNQRHAPPLALATTARLYLFFFFFPLPFYCPCVWCTSAHWREATVNCSSCLRVIATWKKEKHVAKIYDNPCSVVSELFVIGSSVLRALCKNFHSCFWTCSGSEVGAGGVFCCDEVLWSCWRITFVFPLRWDENNLLYDTSWKSYTCAVSFISDQSPSKYCSSSCVFSQSSCLFHHDTVSVAPPPPLNWNLQKSFNPFAYRHLWTGMWTWLDFHLFFFFLSQPHAQRGATVWKQNESWEISPPMGPSCCGIGHALLAM